MYFFFVKGTSIAKKIKNVFYKKCILALLHHHNAGFAT